MEYSIECKKCNEKYPTDINTFNKVVPFLVKLKVALSDNRKVSGVIIQLDKGCSHCLAADEWKAMKPVGRVILLQRTNKTGTGES